jgi:hypothetical protein
MALGIDREKFNKMVEYVRANVGGSISVKKHRDPDNLEIMVRHYMSNYNLYPDEPILEYNNEMTLIKIKESYNERCKNK